MSQNKAYNLEGKTIDEYFDRDVIYTIQKELFHQQNTTRIDLIFGVFYHHM